MVSNWDGLGKAIGMVGDGMDGIFFVIGVFWELFDGGGS